MKKLEITFIVFFALVLALALGRNGSANPGIARNSLFWMVAWSVGALLIFPGNRLPLRISKSGLILVGLILGYGWLMVVNARAYYLFNELSFQEISGRIWEGGPGSIAKTASATKMIEVSGLFLVFFAAVRSRGSETWKRLLAILPLLGAVITIVGLFHRVLDAPSVWFVDQTHPATFFAPFIYNANAGSYLNFSGALGFSFWVSSFWKGSRSRTIGWAIITALCFVGVIATASKGAFLILLLTLGLCLFFHRKRLLKYLPGIWVELKGRGFEGKLIILAIIVMILSFAGVGVQNLITRMDSFIEDARDGSAATVEGRLTMMRMMGKMASLDEGGWVGFGPGSFEIIVPYFTVDEAYALGGRLEHGHSDPLQLLVEWGYLGAFLWIAFGLGALRSGLGGLKSRKEQAAKPLIRGMMIALISMTLHSGFDFPFGIFSLKFAAVFVCGLLWGRSETTRARKRSSLES